MTHRTSAGAALVLLLLMAMGVPAMAPGAAAPPDEHRGVVGSPPPAEGDWEVDEDAVVTDADVVVQGNITVREGCELRLVGSNLMMRDTHAHAYTLWLEVGASLVVERSSLLLDAFDADEESSLRVLDGSIHTGGVLLARCHEVEVDGGELLCEAHDGDIGVPGEDALMVLDGRDGPGLTGATIRVLGGSAGPTSPGENGSSGGSARLISNVTNWTGCQVEVEAGESGSGGLGLPGVSGGDGGLGGDAEAVLQGNYFERTTIRVNGTSGGNGAGGADNNTGDAGDGGNGTQGGLARLSITSPSSIELHGCVLCVKTGDGGSGGNGGTARDGDGGDAGLGANAGAAILEVYSIDDIHIEGSTMTCVGGAGGYGGDFGRKDGTVGDIGIPKPGGAGGTSNASITSTADFFMEGTKVTSRGGMGNDGGSGYDQGETGGDGGAGILRIRIEAGVEAADIDLSAFGGNGGKGGPAISGISGNGGNGGDAILEFTGRLSMDVDVFDIFLYPGLGGKGNSVVWDGKPGLPTLDVETIFLEMRDGRLNQAFDDLADTARGHLYNCSIDAPLPVMPIDDAEAWTYYPVDIWVVDSSDPSKRKPLVGFEVRIISVKTGAVVAIAITDEQGRVHVELPSFHYTSRTQEYMGGYIVVVISPDGKLKKEVRLDVQGPIPNPISIIVPIPPKRFDIYIERPENATTLVITPMNSTVEVVGHILDDDDAVNTVIASISHVDDTPVRITDIALQGMSIPVSDLLIDDEKWNRFFRPEEYQNRWMFFCRFDILGNSTEETYVDGYYEITLEVSKAARSATVKVTIWLDINRDLVPTVTLMTPLDTVDWNTTDLLVLTGTAWDDKGVVRVEVRIDDGPWSEVNGTTEWSYTLDVRAIPEGFHTIYLRASDGLSESPKVSWSISLVRPVDGGDGDGGSGRYIVPAAIALALIVLLVAVAIVVLKHQRGGHDVPRKPLIPPPPK